jgi:membrane fusion protein, adhesin transport system
VNIIARRPSVDSLKPETPALHFPRRVDTVAQSTHGLFLASLSAACVALFAWTSLTEIDKIVRGPAQVVPEQKDQIVQHFEGGIVTDILVHEGDRVEKGAPLLKVRNSFSNAEMLQAQHELKALQIKLFRLRAEAEGRDSFLVTPDLSGEVPETEIRERSLFQRRREVAKSDADILSAQATQKQIELSELKSRYTNTQHERELTLQRYNNVKKLVPMGAVSANEMLDNERSVQQIDSRLSDIINEIPKAEAAYAEFSSRLKGLDLRFRNDAEKERSEVELQVAKLTQSIAALTDRSQRTDVSAPTAGIVNKLFINTVGGVVKSGEALVQIVPIDSAITIEAKLSPADRAGIWPGLPAIVKISAYEYSVYGGLRGKVVDVSSDALQDERGQSYFRVKIEADKGGFGPDRPVVPGMTADVNIISGRQTILAAILSPLHRIKDNALR